MVASRPVLSRSRAACRLEAVADARFGLDELRADRVRFDLPPEVADVHAEILLRVTLRVAPHRPEQLPMRERLARMRDERAKEQPLGRREMEQFARAFDPSLLEVDANVAERRQA